MKKRHIMTMLALMLLTAAVTYCVTIYETGKYYNAILANLSTRQQEYAKIAEVRDYIDKFYVNEYDESEIIDGAAAGMVAMLGDQWSHYLTAEQFAAMNAQGTKYVGIGISASYDEATSELVVLEVFEGSPAEYAKIQQFDRIIVVDGEEVSKIGYEAAVNKIKGPEETPVSITIVREGVEEPINLSVTRREIDEQNVKSKILDGNIGYIRISAFEENVDKDVINALANLQKANVVGIIFDVRNNPGGLLSVLVNTLDQLLPQGVIIREIDKYGNEETFTSDAKELNLPMAVLTNGDSISAAEFFAAALQEKGKATIVGEPTTGKGVTQSQIQLKDGSGLVLSISKHYTENRVNLGETGGLMPDRLVELTDEERKKINLQPLEQDKQLQAAVAVINEKIMPPADQPTEQAPDDGDGADAADAVAQPQE